MKTIKEAKARMKVGQRLLCVKNTYRPKMDGTFRTITKMGATTWRYKMDGSDAESFSYWPSGITIVGCDTFRIPMKRGGVTALDGQYVELRFVDPVPESSASPIVKATPGPWRFQEQHIRSVGGDERVEFVIYRNDGKGYRNPAICSNMPDAMLVAAAPDLLRQLEDVVEHFHQLVDSRVTLQSQFNYGLLADARKTIAAAKGGAV